MKKIQLTHLFPVQLRTKIAKWGQYLSFVVACITIGAIVIDYGYHLHPYERGMLEYLYHASWIAYSVSYLISLLFLWKSITRKNIVATIIWGVLLSTIGISKFIDLPPAYNWLGHHLIEMGVLGLFSALELSRGVIGLINKRTNPVLLMAGSFILFIALGTLLLLLPRSTQEGFVLPVVDALFISTSAVCVTGLTPLDIAQVFTPSGQLIIALLIQVGGLGIMTITSFFALFFMGGSTLQRQFAVRDLIGAETLSSLLSTLLNILAFTFAIEAIGAFFIWWSIHGTLSMTLGQEIFFSIFHSISAFCNAGFSTLSGNLGNPSLLTAHNGFFWAISLLIILGGLGYPILINFKTIVFYRIKRWVLLIFRRPTEKKAHLTQLNTKIVLTSTLVLVLVGTIVLAILEWDGAFKGMSVADKITHSFINAVSPRTAGFNTIELPQFGTLSILLYLLLMWIGGGSQSTAGGIKVNTLAVVLANFVSILKGRQHVVLFNREVSDYSIKKASAVVVGSICCIIIFYVLLLLLEPPLPTRGLLFETLSAFSTVGASLNITPLLGDASKLLITLLMFIGRIGFISLLMSFTKRGQQPHYRYPKDHVIIN